MNRRTFVRDDVVLVVVTMVDVDWKADAVVNNAAVVRAKMARHMSSMDGAMVVGG